MSDVISGKPPTSFWIIGGVALVWNLIGLMLYYMQVSATPEMLAAVYSEAEYEFLVSIPIWATTAHAIAVTAGVLGCILLLMRNAWAMPVFIVSLIGILVQDIYSFVIANGIEVWGVGVIILPIVVLVIAIGLVFYSRSAKDQWGRTSITY
ncbi:MAG: hypothetical protein KAJ57_09920 [Woeseiaceae bacterium]|nr:hypothetical protein [Woeseiaceae bacterium]